jgi:hypothetical protein
LLIVWAVAWGLNGCGADGGEYAKPYFDVPVTCDNFCNLMLRHCREKWQMYPSFGDCLNTCAGWPNDSSASLTQGNTLQCRFTYATLARRTASRAWFCVNGGPTGGQMCQD